LTDFEWPAYAGPDNRQSINQQIGIRGEEMGLGDQLTRVGAALDEPVGADLRWHVGGFARPVRFLDVLVPLLKIRDRRGKLVPLKPNAAQRQYAQSRGPRNIILKARQVGITTYISARLFLSALLRPGTTALQVAHSLESAQQIFRIVHRFYSHLPAAIQTARVTERANVRELAFANTDSRFRVETAGNPGAGRGLTLTHLHASEVSEWPGEAEETMAALVAAVGPDGTIDIEATPKGLGGYFHAEWVRARENESGTVRHFFPWWIEPEYSLPVWPDEEIRPETDAEHLLVEREGLTAEQLKFRRHLERTFRGLRAQEFAENDVECFLASGRAVFEGEAIERRVAQAGDPARTGENGGEHQWAPPLPGRHYVIGVDPAEGRADGDLSAAQVVDAATGLQCLELAVRWPVERFAEHVAMLGHRYNEALVAVERNNHGHAVIYALRHRHGYRRLYRHGPGEGDLAIGWPTNAQTKPQMVAALAGMLADAPVVFQSRRLLGEMRAYAYDESGATNAPEGMHDDLLVAMGIALVVRGQAKWAATAALDLNLSAA
jgi:hypothetical protein